MSTIIVRRICAMPKRTASETWSAVVEMLRPSDKARTELQTAAGVVCAAIASESTRFPIVIWGSGPRVRIYTLFDEEAITGDDASEATLQTSPCDGDWHMSIPTPEADVAWSKTELAACAHIEVRAEADDVTDDGEAKGAAAKGAAMQINVKEFLKS